MTRIECFIKNGKDIGFRMEGHAGYGAPGADILCAALSAASQMTSMGIYSSAGINYSDIEYVTDEDKALYMVRVEEPGERGTAIFEQFRLYVLALAYDYPGHVIVKEVKQ